MTGRPQPDVMAGPNLERAATNVLNGLQTLLNPPITVGEDLKRLVKSSVSLARVIVEQQAGPLDGDPVTETVDFSYRGNDYRIELSARSADAMDRLFAPYVEAARPVAGRRPGTRPAAPKAGRGASVAAKDVRAWAVAQGIPVPQRGRVSADLIHQYLQAQHG